MSDPIDLKIRSFLVEVLDGAPPVPEFSDIAAAAVRTDRSPLEPRSARPAQKRRKRVVLIAALGTALVVTGAVLATRTGSPSRVTVNTPSTDVPGKIRPAETPPAVVTGTQQVLRAAPVSPDFVDLWTTTSPWRYQLVDGTTPQGLSINGTTPFAVADFASGGPASTPEAPAAPFPAAVLLTMGTLPNGGQGLGIGVGQVSYHDLDVGLPALFNVWDYPVPTQQLWVWAHLPEDTAFVTVVYSDTTRLWQRPVGNVAAFFFEIPEPQRHSPASSTDPVPHLVAYDVNGTVLAQAEGPPR